MNKFWPILFLLVQIALFPPALSAQTMVLIPGFLSQGMSWRFTQVTPALQSNAWVDGGNFYFQQGKISNSLALTKRPDSVFYTIDLPTTETIERQAYILNQYLQLIAGLRNEPLILVGHSAGGVVARHWLVTQNTVPVSTLITIASPHLGTPLAEISRFLSSIELLKMAELLGFNQLKDAGGLFKDLRQEQPGTYLYWLNHQPHPAIRYVSVVRNSETPESLDLIVPSYSQDMNHVFALRGKTERWNSESGHLLSMDDGFGLLQIIQAPAN